MSVESNLHTSQSLEARETYSLIGSDKVEGTAVYRSNGEKIGKIIRLMIGKQSGKVGYAVMSFGGFMGIGEDYYPLPWSLLTYNPGWRVTKSTSPMRSSRARQSTARTKIGTGAAAPGRLTTITRFNQTG